MKPVNLLLAALAVSLAVVAARPAVGQELQISEGTGREKAPQISFEPSSTGFLVVWQDFRSGIDWDIYGQRVVDGVRVGPEIPIAVTEDNEQVPFVASKPGMSLVVWSESQGAGPLNRVRAQRVASDGTLIGTRLGIASTAQEMAIVCGVAYSSDSDAFMVIWKDQIDNDGDIYARMVASDGSMGSPIGVCSDQEVVSYPCVTYNTVDKEFLVAWTAPDGLWGKRFMSAGIPPVGLVHLHALSSQASESAVAHGAFNNSYLVVWSDDRNASIDIYGRMFDHLGSPLGSEFRLSTSDLFEDNHADVTFVDLGPVFKVVWNYYGFDGWSGDILSRQVDYDGDLYPETPICVGLQLQSHAAVASGTTETNYQSLIAWEDFRNGPDAVDIYGFTEMGHAIRVCGQSRVNLGCGAGSNVLLLNDSPGGRDHDVHVPFGSSITVTMDPSPGGPSPAPFAMYLWLGQPDGEDVTPHPKNLGNFCFPTPITGGAPQPKKIWNNIGKTAILGNPTYPSTPAPSEVLKIQSGISFPVTAVFQGLIVDNCSSADKPASITNAIMLVVP